MDSVEDIIMLDEIFYSNRDGNLTRTLKPWGEWLLNSSHSLLISCENTKHSFLALGDLQDGETYRGWSTTKVDLPKQLDDKIKFIFWLLNNNEVSYIYVEFGHTKKYFTLYGKIECSLEDRDLTKEEEDVLIFLDKVKDLAEVCGMEFQFSFVTNMADERASICDETGYETNEYLNYNYRYKLQNSVTPEKDN